MEKEELHFILDCKEKVLKLVTMNREEAFVLIYEWENRKIERFFRSLVK